MSDVATEQIITAAERLSVLTRGWRQREMDTSALIGTVSGFAREAGSYTAILERAGRADEAEQIKSAIAGLDRAWCLAIIEERYEELRNEVPKAEEVELLAHMAVEISELQLAEKLRALITRGEGGLSRG